jgi:Caspase domain
MKSCALVVGVNEYPAATGMGRLYGAVADAADFADWVLHPDGGNVAPQHLYFWTFPAPAQPSPLLANYLANATAWKEPGAPDATRGPDLNDIGDTALHMAETLPAAGIARIYVFFAGHGVQTASVEAQVEVQTCFVANDFRPSGRTRGLVPCEDLRRGLLASGFSEVVMFLDCCRTPVNFTQDPPSLGWPRGALPDSPYAVGRAARRGTKAFEEPEAHPTSRGAFSRVLMQGLRCRRDERRVLTLNDLENYVYLGVPRVLRNRQQFPQFEIEPRNPPYPLITGPAISQAIPIIVHFRSLAPGTTVQLTDSNGVPVGAPVIAGPDPVTIDAEGGKLYSLETPDQSFTKGFRHEGPGATHVDL